MSQSTTSTPPKATDSLGSFDVETPEGPATVEVAGTPTNRARIDVELESGRRWIFGVNDDVAALVLVLNENGGRVDPELPSWIEPVIQRTGLEGIDS